MFGQGEDKQKWGAVQSFEEKMEESTVVSFQELFICSQQEHGPSQPALATWLSNHAQ